MLQRYPKTTKAASNSFLGIKHGLKAPKLKHQTNPVSRLSKTRPA